MHSFNVPGWLREKQEHAEKQRVLIGLPIKTDEAWKYTSLRTFDPFAYSPISMKQDSFLPPEEVQFFSDGADHILYFYNGDFIKVSSRLNMQEELLVVPLSRALMSAGRIQENAKELLARVPNRNLKSLGWAHQSHFREGAFVHIDNNAKGRSRVAVVHMYGHLQSASEQKPFVVYPKNVYSFGQNARADIFEIHLSVNEIAFHISNASDWILGPSAQVQAAQVQQVGAEAYVFNDVYASLKKESHLDICHLTIGGKVIRNELDYRLVGEQATLGAYELVLAKGQSHIDNSSCISHEVGSTKSVQLAKSVLDDSACFVFSGRLLIEEEAQKSDASQYNHNLLLSENAEANSRPQLEVNADDVKAAHGATVGQMREDELFYLQSRGIPRPQAEALLSSGFERDVIEKISSTFIQSKLTHSLAGAHK